MTATTSKQNLTSGKYAVALVGYRGWGRDSAIGDGIKAALRALVTRCGTMAEAEAMAARLNEAQPLVLPGSQDVPVYEARRYHRDDYISRQDLAQAGGRDCDRRIAGL
jgi:hypothetical protein